MKWRLVRLLFTAGPRLAQRAAGHDDAGQEERQRGEQEEQPQVSQLRQSGEHNSCDGKDESRRNPRGSGVLHTFDNRTAR